MNVQLSIWDTMSGTRRNHDSFGIVVIISPLGKQEGTTEVHFTHSNMLWSSAAHDVPCQALGIHGEDDKNGPDLCHSRCFRCHVTKLPAQSDLENKKELFPYVIRKAESKTSFKDGLFIN